MVRKTQKWQLVRIRCRQWVVEVSEPLTYSFPLKNRSIEQITFVEILQVEVLRIELQRAEIELEDRCWIAPPVLQHWLQITYELETQVYNAKKKASEDQLEMAKDLCEKLKKKRSSLVGAFVPLTAVQLTRSINLFLGQKVSSRRHPRLVRTHSMLATDWGSLWLPDHNKYGLGTSQIDGEECGQGSNGVIGVWDTNFTGPFSWWRIIEWGSFGGCTIRCSVALFDGESDANVVCYDAVVVDAEIGQVLDATYNSRKQQRIPSRWGGKRFFVKSIV